MPLNPDITKKGDFCPGTASLSAPEGLVGMVHYHALGNTVPFSEEYQKTIPHPPLPIFMVFSIGVKEVERNLPASTKLSAGKKEINMSRGAWVIQ